MQFKQLPGKHKQFPGQPPPREGITPSQANPPREGITPSQVNTPPREGTVPSQASTTLPLATALPPGKAQCNHLQQQLSLPQAITTLPLALALPPREASTSQATALPSQVSTTLPLALALPPREASASQATGLPTREASTSLTTALPPREANALPWHPLSLPLPGKGSLLLRQIPPLRPLLTLTPLGPPSQVKLVTQLGL